MIGIYMLTFPDGMSYIGQSNNIDRRISEHFDSMELHKNKGIRSRFIKYGHPTVTVLEECGLFDLNVREIYWIAHYNTYNGGLNLTTGGGFKRSGAPVVAPSVLPVTEPDLGAESSIGFIVPLAIAMVIGLCVLIFMWPPSLVLIIIGFLCLR